MGIFKKTLVNSGNLIGVLTGCSLSGTAIYWTFSGIHSDIDNLKTLMMAEKKLRLNFLGSHKYVKEVQQKIKTSLSIADDEVGKDDVDLSDDEDDEN